MVIRSLCLQANVLKVVDHDDKDEDYIGVYDNSDDDHNDHHIEHVGRSR